MSKERIIPNPDGTSAEHLYGAAILYGDGEVMMSAPEGCARQMRMEKSARWTRMLKPLTDRSEALCKKVADAVKSEIKKPKKKATRKRRSKKKPS